LARQPPGRVGGAQWKKRRARLDAIKLACRNYIQDVLLRQLGNIAETAMAESGIAPDWLASPLMETTRTGESALSGTRPSRRNEILCAAAIKVESGAKSAFDSNEPVTIKPYIADDVPAIPLSSDRRDHSRR